MKEDRRINELFLKGHLINREYSWLAFNKRVLDQAMDLSNPLLERCKFLSIYKSNLDEFTQVRLGSLENMAKHAPSQKDDKTELTGSEQLEALLSLYPGFYKEMNSTFSFLKSDLYDKGIAILRHTELSESQKRDTEKYFKDYLLPRISPLVLDQKHPMIRFANLRTYLVLMLEKGGRTMFGVAGLPYGAERIFRIPGGKKINLILSEELMMLYADLIFPGYTIRDKAMVRITRNADFEAKEEDADIEYDYDFSAFLKTKVEERGTLSPIRMEMSPSSEELRSYVNHQVGIKKSHIFISKTYFDFKFLFRLSSYLTEDEVRKYSYKAFKGSISDSLKGRSMIEEVEKRDILLSYPYNSIEPLISLLEEAASDKSTISIKITIYRLADHSRIVSALLKALANGKEVTAVMELCARFDEENNLHYAEVLKEAGAQVFYGMGDYKVHSKIISILREKEGRICYITHLGTGNYNENTSRQYTDLNLITSNQEIGEDGSAFFRNLAIKNTDYEYKHLLVAPNGLKTGIIFEIEREMEKGEDGLIRAKVNSLTDLEVMDKLVEASQRGVKIHLVVRGICCLLPRIHGKTDNISITSIVGRFLEHSRIYAFGKEEQERIYIASADLMTRNLSKRVEIATPILDEEVKKKIQELLSLILSDNVKARRLNFDGTYSKVPSLSSPIDSQEECLKKEKSYQF